MNEVDRDDSPCNGVCRIVEEKNKAARCVSCKRTYDDLEQWLYLSREERLKRMRELKRNE